MTRKESVAGLAALLVFLGAAALLRRCRPSPAEPAPQPMTSFLTAHKNAAPEKKAAAKKSGLSAPTLLNLGDLQANIRKYYPEAEHRAGKEGHVMMGLVVGTDGTPSAIRVETSGGADFDEAAKKVVLAMRFSPARRAGKPVVVEISEGIDFQYEGK